MTKPGIFCILFSSVVKCSIMCKRVSWHLFTQVVQNLFFYKLFQPSVMLKLWEIQNIRIFQIIFFIPERGLYYTKEVFKKYDGYISK